MVDVFITCAGEDTDTILNTTKAACASDYPSDRFRVIVLDDAGSAEVSSAVQSLRKTRNNVYYTARIKGKDHQFKAGNLNHGYDFVKTLPGGPADFIAGLDADMIADPAWLRALLPQLLADPNVALAQCPQVSSAVSLNVLPLLQRAITGFSAHRQFVNSSSSVQSNLSLLSQLSQWHDGVLFARVRVSSETNT
jgi:cellulose synthase/poly-beta-1,6-N-acetylglucosamine synthase-like glycosyltransferase